MYDIRRFIERFMVSCQRKKLDEENEKFELQHEELKRERFRLNSLKDQLANEQRVLKLQIDNRREKITVVLPGVKLATTCKILMIF
jgi:hypothetical protein